MVNNNADSLVTDRKVRRTQEVIQIITSVSGSPGKASPASTELPTIAPALLLGDFSVTHSLTCLSAASGSSVPCDVYAYAHTCNSCPKAQGRQNKSVLLEEALNSKPQPEPRFLQ